MTTIELDDYEVANLRSALYAICGAVFYKDPVWTPLPRNPLWVLNTGDWVSQILSKLPFVEQLPNVNPEELSKRAANFE